MGRAIASRRRIAAAALTAPPVGVVVAYVFVVVLLDLSEDIGPRGLARFFVNFMTVGSAVSYAAGALVGFPAAMLLRRRNLVTFPITVLVGALGGVIAFLPVLRVLAGSASAFAGTLLVGGASGVCSGAWFWLIGLRDRKLIGSERTSQAESQDRRDGEDADGVERLSPGEAPKA